MRRYVLTGAPGAGKTTLADALRRRGWDVVAEAATDVIAAEQEQGGAEPWRKVTPSAARRIGYAESLAFARVHEEVYRAHGHRLIAVPPRRYAHGSRWWRRTCAALPTCRPSGPRECPIRLT
ncbi:AAA family ATPase [Micromonospora sp. NPDC047812]|uniref:AAA family ATPase n=1 Tax=Micromonospora sp. NPDC047812 TaxID=3155742 RepID=UPI003451D722